MSPGFQTPVPVLLSLSTPLRAGQRGVPGPARFAGSTRGRLKAPSSPRLRSCGIPCPAPFPRRAGVAAPPLLARSRGRADAGRAAGAGRSRGRPRRRPLPDARRGRDAICREWLESPPPPPSRAAPPPSPPSSRLALRLRPRLARVPASSPPTPEVSAARARASASASQVSVAATRPRRPGREERAGPAAG